MKSACLRPCYVYYIDKSLLPSPRPPRRGLFHKWVTEQYTKSALLTGSVSGQISTTYGLIEFEDGTVELVSPRYIRFLDSQPLFGEYNFDIDE